MMNKLKLDISNSLVEDEVLQSHMDGIRSGFHKLFSGEEDFTGWVKLPINYDKKELATIVETASKIKKQCEVFVVVGIGGSYLGARAAVEMMGHSFGLRKAGKDGIVPPQVIFAGNNISGTYHAELLEKLQGKEVCICIISKSGTTTEPCIAFAVLKEFLMDKYGKEETNRRIYAITDASIGILRKETEREGYESFVVPDAIGGRYSVLTPVGLLPIAVAGIDVEEMLAGAASVLTESEIFRDGNFHEDGFDYAIESDEEDCMLLQAVKYAAVRYSLLQRGKEIEVVEYYEPKLQYFAEWMKQLYGESEGKEGNGLFPAALQFSADLHSMGQFLQDGNQIFFETILHVTHPEKDLTVPESAGSLLAGRCMNDVNQAAVTGVMAAHRTTNVPMVKIDIPNLTAFTFGQMVYFFETTCALTGYLMGVNPFDQPGVESYKSEMKKAL